jgi:hypothetical protein
MTDLAVDSTRTEHLELSMLRAQQPIDPSQKLASRYSLLASVAIRGAEAWHSSLHSPV